MATFDQKVVDCVLSRQLQLFPEEVASTPEEAVEFLEDVMAVVVKGRKGVKAYFKETGADYMDGDIMEASEVFDVGDGRYLIVEG